MMWLRKVYSGMNLHSIDLSSIMSGFERKHMIPADGENQPTLYKLDSRM